MNSFKDLAGQNNKQNKRHWERHLD